MKESRPGVRAIVASGYLEPAMRSEMLKAGVLDTIQKPYDFSDLLAKIRASSESAERRRSSAVLLSAARTSAA